MSVSEKTLEIAITHEILSLADNFLGYTYMHGYPYRRHWKRKLPFVTGLTLDAEKKYGYDVKITLPRDFINFGTPYIYFLQFKKGYHKDYSYNTASIFRGSITNKKKHILFGLNNNSSKDQHIKLRNLYNSNIPNRNILVGYALPLIGTVQMYKNCIGDLLIRTPIYEVVDIDNLASIGTVGRIEEGESHHIAISYNGTRKEIRSNPQSIETRDISLELYNEIFAIRLFKNIKYFNYYRFEPLDSIVDLYFESIVDLGFILKIKTDIINEIISTFIKKIERGVFKAEEDVIMAYVRNMTEFSEPYEEDLNEKEEQMDFVLKRRQELFNKLIDTSWLLYSKLFSKDGSDKKLEEIIDMNHLFPFETKEREIVLKIDEEHRKDYTVGGINYTII